MELTPPFSYIVASRFEIPAAIWHDNIPSFLTHHTSFWLAQFILYFWKLTCSYCLRSIVLLTWKQDISAGISQPPWILELSGQTENLQNFTYKASLLFSEMVLWYFWGNVVRQGFCLEFKVLLHIILGLVMWYCSAVAGREGKCSVTKNTQQALSCTRYLDIFASYIWVGDVVL